MDTMTRFDVKPLSSALGAEITGIDLRNEITADTVAEIRRLWNEYIVLVFRDQDLTTEQQRAFASHFGTLGERKRVDTKFTRARYAVYDKDPAIRDDPNFMLVTNVKVDGQAIGAYNEGDMWFHIDSGYQERPYKYTFLHAIKLPSRGGATRFVNMYRAYETLPEALKEKLAGRKALHIHEYKRAEKVDLSKDFSKAPHFYHPVFTTHPETGRKSLFVDRLMTARIEGLEPGESERILERLHAHIENPELVYEHQWRYGDLLMWDNRCTVHGRTDFPREEERILRRCTIEGERPYE